MSGQLKQTNFKKISIELLNWSLNNQFKGFDPYDGLNTPFFSLEIFQKKNLMTFTTQFFKNFPFNLITFLFIKKERNAKGIALFLNGLVNLYNCFGNKKFLDIATELFLWLKKYSSPFSKHFSWGYNFPWQSRNSFKPKYFPNIVTTSFVGLALLRFYEITRKSEALRISTSACNFIINELNKTKFDSGICFSYSPNDREVVYNATLLGSYLLISNWKYTGKNEFLNFGLQSVNFVLCEQNPDGSWYYGKKSNQKWIDNFHTGYNLWILKEISEIIRIEGMEKKIQKGYDFYKKNLFEKSLPKYYLEKKYPLDIHNFAVSTIVFLKFKEIERAINLMNKCVELFLSPKGYFYYRVYPFFKNKIPYMRWSNAWVFLALSEILRYENMD